MSILINCYKNYERGVAFDTCYLYQRVSCNSTTSTDFGGLVPCLGEIWQVEPFLAKTSNRSSHAANISLVSSPATAICSARLGLCHTDQCLRCKLHWQSPNPWTPSAVAEPFDFVSGLGRRRPPLCQGISSIVCSSNPWAQRFKGSLANTNMRRRSAISRRGACLS